MSVFLNYFSFVGFLYIKKERMEGIPLSNLVFVDVRTLLQCDAIRMPGYLL